MFEAFSVDLEEFFLSLPLPLPWRVSASFPLPISWWEPIETFGGARWTWSTFGSSDTGAVCSGIEELGSESSRISGS